MRSRRVEPSPLRWLIGVELARFRHDTRISLTEAAERIGMSRAKVGHLETGFQQQDPDDIARVLRAYGVSDHAIDRLASLTGQADAATWWAPWANVVPDWFRTFVGLEAIATSQFIFEPMVIPGLLQTSDYSDSVTQGHPRVRPDHGERVSSFRNSRARRLTDRLRALEFHAVIAESALHLAVGTEEVRRAQLKHLIELARLPNVTVQILRPDDGLPTVHTGTFVLLDFDQARSIAYCELLDGAVYVQEPEEVRSYMLAAEGLREIALGPEKSLTLLRSALRTM